SAAAGSAASCPGARPRCSTATRPKSPISTRAWTFAGIIERMAEAAFNWKHAGPRWPKPVTLVLLLLPAIWLAAHWVVLILYVTGNPAPGADLLLRGPWLPSGNPVQTTHHFLGETAIRILLVTLAIRPVKEITGWAP